MYRPYVLALQKYMIRHVKTHYKHYVCVYGESKGKTEPNVGMMNSEHFKTM
jgi:hypothetical protein